MLRRVSTREAAMHEMRAHLEKLRSDARDCALVSLNATDVGKRELFARLSEHLNRLAQEVERALAETEADDRQMRG